MKDTTTPAAETVRTYPLLDKTGMSVGTYIVGGKCGRDGSFGAYYGAGSGKLYSVARDTEGTYAVTYPLEGDRDAADVATLMSYLLGPRHVRVFVWRQGAYSFTDTKLAETDVTVQGGADPDDWMSWSDWVREYGKRWYDEHPAQRGNTALYFAAADIDVAHLTGTFGYRSLASVTISATGELL